MGYKGLVGNSAIDRAGGSSNNVTHIDLVTTSPYTGLLRSITIYCGADSSDFKVKIFRDDGTNYVFVNECGPFTTATGGTNTFACSMMIQAGDFIGFWSNTANVVDQVTSGGTIAYKAGEVTATSAKATWSTTNNIMSINGGIYGLAPALSY